MKIKRELVIYIVYIFQERTLSFASCNFCELVSFKIYFRSSPEALSISLSYKCRSVELLTNLEKQTNQHVLISPFATHTKRTENVEPMLV